MSLNLAIAIALAARAKRYPNEWARLVEFQNTVHTERKRHHVIVASEVGLRDNTWLEESECIKRCFALKKVGDSPRAPMPYGYCRLPNHHLPARPGIRRRIGTARFEPDIEEVFNVESL